MNYVKAVVPFLFLYLYNETAMHLDTLPYLGLLALFLGYGLWEYATAYDRGFWHGIHSARDVMAETFQKLEDVYGNNKG